MSEKKLYVVGIGPGRKEDMTIRAVEALKKSQLIIGYTTYVKLIREEFSSDPEIAGSQFSSTGMTEEIKRCRQALEMADQGMVTSLVCSGDAGIYGMASPALELKKDFPDVRVDIIPGVTAASSGAALCGAPLGHDFAVISLSDRLTGWDLIEKRLRAAAWSDMAIALYNPASHGRPDTLKKAAWILMDEGLPEDRICALARHIGREGEHAVLTSLGMLGQENCDMQTTVFIGSSSTYEEAGKMITPRGYRGK